METTIYGLGLGALNLKPQRLPGVAGFEGWSLELADLGFVWVCLGCARKNGRGKSVLSRDSGRVLLKECRCYVESFLLEEILHQSGPSIYSTSVSIS